MNKPALTEFHRLFLIESLPEPLTAASSHLQIFDNYIEKTRMRLRLMRDPLTKVWTRILQQRFAIDDSGQAVTKLAEIHLNDAEYGVLERFRGREIRKNRYFHEFDRMVWTFDCYLGEARGLNIAKIDLDSREQMTDLVPPPFALIEITGDPFFSGENLVAKDYAEIRAEVERIGSQIRPVSEMPDE